MKSPKIPAVLNAWECKIQDGRHLANIEIRAVGNIIHGREIDDLRGQTSIVVCIINHDNIHY